MKNVKVIIDKQEIKDMVYSLWTTDAFKKSHKEEGGYINQIVDQFADYPKIFAEMTNSELEWSQFYSYFNILIKRTYFNKTIQDLYYLHEIVHMATMLYHNKIEFEAWLKKMISNEMEASLESEIYVYKHLGIRDSSFNFEIWYDSLEKSMLDDRNAVRRLRKDRMKNPITSVELILNKYQNNNYIWGQIWKSNYQAVESALCKFHQDCHDDPRAAMDEFMKFIDKNTTDGIVFKEEAEKFSKVYLNK